jgi:hypothetical protein
METSKEYMLAIIADETYRAPQPGEPGFEESMAAWAEYTQMLMQGGHWLNGASLVPSEATTQVRLGGPTPTIVDGPYFETKEQLAGYYVVTARDLDQAIELAGKIPIPGGVIEVRPISVRPDSVEWQPGPGHEGAAS